MKALEIRGLHKSFKSNFLIKQYHILKGIDVSVEKGEIYGFLGPNGAGKTTTMKCILGIIFPDSGEISINGKPANSISSRNDIGFLPEHPYFYDYLTPQELLTFTGRLFNLPKARIREKSAELMELAGLTQKKDVKLRKFSKGMIQRIGLAQALIHDPEFVILDEPFSGLDPIGRKELRDIIMGIKETGKTVFFSSHILQDMEMMVDRVGIILNGEIKKEGRLSELISHSVRYYEIVFTGISGVVLAELDIECQFRDGDYIAVAHSIDESNRIIRTLSESRAKIKSVTPVKRTLEDIFLEQVNENKNG